VNRFKKQKRIDIANMEVYIVTSLATPSRRILFKEEQSGLFRTNRLESVLLGGGLMQQETLPGCIQVRAIYILSDSMKSIIVHRGSDLDFAGREIVSFKCCFFSSTFTDSRFLSLDLIRSDDETGKGKTSGCEETGDIGGVDGGDTIPC